MVKFDLTSLPAGANIRSATLKLYTYLANYSGSATYYAYRISTDWAEGTVTWNYPWSSAGGDYTTQDAASVNVSGTYPMWVEWDVTAIVQDWTDGSPNHGFLIKDAIETTGYYNKFYSREAGAYEPVLAVDYTTGPTPTPSDTPTPSNTPTITPTPTITATPTVTDTPGACTESLTVTWLTNLSSGYVVDFGGNEYYTARLGARDHIEVSPVQIGDPTYDGSAYSGSGYVYTFKDNGTSIDTGGKYMYTTSGYAWNLPLTTDGSCQTVTIYTAILHTSTVASDYTITADTMSESLSIPSYYGRKGYKIVVTFNHNLTVRMTPQYTRSGAYFLLNAAEVEP